MKFIENTFENFKNQVEKKVEQAISNAFDLDKNSKLFSEGLITQEKMLKEFDAGTITADSLVEFRIILDKIVALKIVENFGKKEAEEAIAHENAHGNKAEELGAKHHGYVVHFMKKQEKDYTETVFAAVTSMPKEWNSRKKRIVLSKITEAPEFYGGSKMSKYDIETLKELLEEEVSFLENKFNNRKDENQK
jgi:hypothetical protein